MDTEILLIEDDPEIAGLVKEQVADLGFQSVWLQDGRSGLARALEEEFLMVIVDLGLPELGGLEVCRTLRSKKPSIPIMILTAETSKTKTVLGLELGADEYLTKPFNVMELRARIHALLRRVNASQSTAEGRENSSAESMSLRFRDLEVDIGTRKATAAGQQLLLTPTEYDLLVLFLRFPKRVLSREEILSTVWGDENSVYAHNVRSHISSLRNKLAESGKQGPYIVTRRGFGYCLAGEGDSEE